MKKWTSQEDDFLIKNYNENSFIKIKEFLHQRSDDAIRRRAKDLGLTQSKAKEWSSEEIEILKSDLPESLIVEKIGRTLSAIRKKKAIERAKLNTTVDYSKFFDLSVIEDDVPKINKNSKSSHYYALLNSLKDGQSFEYPSNEKELVRNQIQLLPHKKFQTKKWNEDTRRVWRIKQY